MDLQNRKSPRASWHDYNGGAYFVTICTKNKTAYFGKCTDGMVNFSQIGAWANEQLQNVKQHYPYAEIPLWVVMPNHIHLIIFINSDGRDKACLVKNTKNNADAARDIPTKHHNLLSTCIGGIKSAVTKYVHENGIDFAWQTRFHDHIIRDQNEMNAIADYIETNPLRW